MKADTQPMNANPALRAAGADVVKASGLGPISNRLEKQRILHSRTGARPKSDPKIGVGLWVDHRKAVIVFVTAKGATTTLILSHIDKQPGRTAGLRSTTRFEPQLVPADDSRERRYTGQLDLYYDSIIACIRSAPSILAFGPGEAKGELRRRLALSKFDPRAFDFEIADKMTALQIASRTRQWLADARMVPLPPSGDQAGRTVEDSLAIRDWCAMWESNPPLKLGKLAFYR